MGAARQDADSRDYPGFLMRGEMLGLERRHIWRDEDKLEIVMSVGIDGATVMLIATAI